MLSNQSKNEFQNNVGGQKKKTQVTFMANDKKKMKRLCSIIYSEKNGRIPIVMEIT